MLDAFMTHPTLAVKFISTRNTNCMLLITPCHPSCVTMATFYSVALHTVLYALALSPGRSSNVIVHPQQPRMNLGEDLLQDHHSEQLSFILLGSLRPQTFVYKLTNTYIMLQYIRTHMFTYTHTHC